MGLRMRILCVDIGTGTQDIFLYDSQLDLENGFKLVVPAPTMMVHRRLREATRRGDDIVLTGVTMGGGPSQWAAEEHLRTGFSVFATPDAARSFNDDLAVIREMGIQVIGQEEVARLPDRVVRLELRDFDFDAIARALAVFDVSLSHLDALAVAVFDHGAAPPGYSDRQFRFDYIAERIQANQRLSTFAFPAEGIPHIMTRMQAVADSAASVQAPLVMMDTAPAAVFGATFDPQVQDKEQVMVANVGNFHTLAFRLGPQGIEAVFEHHTGMLDREKLDRLLTALANGSLSHEEVFADHGHGAWIGGGESSQMETNEYGVVITGPRRNLMLTSTLRPYFATPFGDMMLAGCFGLLAAVADIHPELGATIWPSLRTVGATGKPPWEV